MPDDYTYSLMTNGVAVVSAPAEIDICNAEQLRIVLREASRRGHARVVVDMTGTRFCDSEGFSVLVAVHKWALAEGGGLRLVIPAGRPVLRIFRAIGPGALHLPVREPGTGPGPRTCRRRAPSRRYRKSDVYAWLAGQPIGADTARRQLTDSSPA